MRVHIRYIDYTFKGGTMLWYDTIYHDCYFQITEDHVHIHFRPYTQ